MARCHCCLCPLPERGLGARAASPPTALTLALSQGKRGPSAAVTWHTDYAQAMAEAERQNKMLLIYFCDTEGAGPCRRFKAETLDDPQVKSKLQEYVCVELPLAAKIKVHGKDVVLLEHEAFGEMLRRPGIAIVDFRARQRAAAGRGGEHVSDHREALVHARADGGDPGASLRHAHPADADLRGADPSRQAGQHGGGAAARPGGRGREPFAVSGGHPAPGPSLLGLAFPADRRPAAGRTQRPRGLRGELAGREPGRGGRRVRPLLAAFRRPLGRGAGAAPLLRLRHETRRQRRLVRHRNLRRRGKQRSRCRR